MEVNVFEILLIDVTYYIQHVQKLVFNVFVSKTGQAESIDFNKIKLRLILKSASLKVHRLTVDEIGRKPPPVPITADWRRRAN